MDEDTPSERKASWLKRQLTPSFSRGSDGKLFRNIGVGVTVLFAAAAAPAVAAAATPAAAASALGATAADFVTPWWDMVSSIFNFSYDLVT